jgi:predicted HicB family RNase H-like nuclease
MMEYKGYIGKVDFDDGANIFHGEVINTRDVITFQGSAADEVRQAFHDSVADYLAFCQQLGHDPEKPCTGKLILRLPPDLQRRASVAARQAKA